jgi:hypothetical protein
VFRCQRLPTLCAQSKGVVNSVASQATEMQSSAEAMTKH